ncbi:MAG TPA: LPS assembly lipoprotein LptE [Woeseiaceae bacterium]|nr:LPS assembly lipoprotein LptE [Woeseiaceae bacterium]
MSSSRRLLLGNFLALVLAGCGFHLRGAPDIPPEMARTYIATDERYSLFYRKLAAHLEQAGIELVDSPEKATAELVILADDTGQRVLSVSARNVPREYEVYYTIYYSLVSGPAVLMEPQLKTLTRDYTYDETRVLGKAREEDLLREAIADDLVRLVMFQLSSLHQSVGGAPASEAS